MVTENSTGCLKINKLFSSDSKEERKKATTKMEKKQNNEYQFNLQQNNRFRVKQSHITFTQKSRGVSCAQTVACKQSLLKWNNRFSSLFGLFTDWSTTCVAYKQRYHCTERVQRVLYNCICSFL